MKKICFFSVITIMLSLLVFGCNKGETEDVITDIVKKNSSSPANNGANNEGYGTVVPGTGSSSSSSSSSGAPVPVIVKLVFAGDTVLSGKVSEAVTGVGGGNYQFPFQYVADYLKGADLAFVNLESIVTSGGSSNSDSALRADPAAISGLTYAGIDVVSVANDHAFDYGRTGFTSSLQNLTGAGITSIGGGTFDECYTAKILTVKGARIAFLAFTNLGNEYNDRAQKNDSSQGLTAQSGIAWFYSKYVGPAIVSAKNQADIVVVSLHMGKVGSNLPNLYQDKYAHYCVDQGAHLVIGHHSGMIQPVMAYMKGYIANSLGNLITDQSSNKGMILEVVLTDKKITQVSRKYVQMNGSYQAVVQ